MKLGTWHTKCGVSRCLGGLTESTIQGSHACTELLPNAVPPRFMLENRVPSESPRPWVLYGCPLACIPHGRHEGRLPRLWVEAVEEGGQPSQEARFRVAICILFYLFPLGRCRGRHWSRSCGRCSWSRRENLGLGRGVAVVRAHGLHCPCHSRGQLSQSTAHVLCELRVGGPVMKAQWQGDGHQGIPCKRQPSSAAQKLPREWL